jgi:hypothetical protein
MPNRFTGRLQRSVLLLALCLPAYAQVISWECTEAELPKKASPEAALAYLKRDRQNLSSACVIQAIRNLGTAHYQPAIDVLVSYLDFGVPVQTGMPLVFQGGATSGLCPAADALARMGKPALPAVKRAVTNDALPTQSRVNAAKVLLLGMESDNKPEAIHFIVSAARNAKDVVTEDALQKEAKDFVRWCSDAEKPKCKEALDEQ